MNVSPCVVGNQCVSWVPLQQWRSVEMKKNYLIKALSQSLSTNFIIVYSIPTAYPQHTIKILQLFCCCHFCENSALQECCKKRVFFAAKAEVLNTNTLQQNFKLQANVASMSIWTLFQSSLLLSVELVSELCNRIHSCQRAHDDIRVLVYLRSWSGNKRFHQQIHLYKNLWVWEEEQQKLHWWIWSEREEEKPRKVGGEGESIIATMVGVLWEIISK